MVKKIISENLGVDLDALQTDSKFVEDLGADSLNIVEVVMAIEEEFDIEIPDEDAEDLETVDQLEKYIEDNS